MALTKITPQMFDTSAAGHDFNIDNGTFFVDASANRVGIGTTTPSTLLDVNGTATATTFVGALTGNVTGNLTGTILTAAQTNITSLGTLTTLTVDDITINGSTISDAADLTIDVGGGIVLDADDSGTISFKDGGTRYGVVQKASNNFEIQSMISDGDLVIKGNDGGSTITALTLDMSEGGNATFSSAVTTGGNIIGGGHLTLPDNGALRLGAANDLEIYHDGSNTYIDNKNSPANLLLRDADAIILRKYGTSDNMIHCAGGGAVNLYHNGSLKLQTSSTGAIVTGKLTSDNLHVEYASNVSVANLAEVDDYAPVRFGDFRADQSDNLYIMSVGGGKIGMQARDDSASGATRTLSLNPFGGNVGIGETSFSNYLAPDLVVVASAQNGGITVKSSSTSHAGSLAFADATSGTDTYDGYVQYEHNNRALTFGTAANERVRINSGGNVGIGTSSPAQTLAVLKTTNYNPPGLGASAGHFFFGKQDGSGAGSYGLLGGTAGTGNSWLQVQRIDGSATAYNLLLQPSGGNIGIGTSSPDMGSGWNKVLHLHSSSSGSHIRFTDSSTGATGDSGLFLGQYTAGSYFINRENGLMAFYTNNAERIRILSGGDVGIGTTSPFGQTSNRRCFSVNGTSSTSLNIGVAGSQRVYMYSDGTFGQIATVGDIPLRLGNNDTPRMAVTSAGLLPHITNTYDLGSSLVRWRNIYSQDLHLSNEDTGGNDVDGTEGNWTIQEGEEHLYIINNKTGKKFRFALEEVT